MKVQRLLNDSKVRVPWAAYVEDALDGARCDQLRARIDAAGPAVAPISTAAGEVMNPRVRNNERVMFDDPELAAELFARTRACLPDVLHDGQLIGYNERFRGYRYRPGQRFAPHFDGAYFRSGLPREGSQLTLLFYLNDDCEGGATRLIDYDLVIRPRKGALFIFEHAVHHEGCEVTSGVKYVLRSDAMYRFESVAHDE